MDESEKVKIIRYYIEQNIAILRNSKIALYPMGKCGRLLDFVLNNEYKINVSKRIDKDRSKASETKESVENNDFLYLVCTSYRWIAEEIVSTLKENDKYICIILDYREQFKINRRIEHLGILTSCKCNLKCKNCADLCWKRPQNDYEISNIKRDLDKVMDSVNGIDELLLVGGETLLYKNLEELIEYCGSIERIREIIVTTNGTIMPKLQLFEVMKKYNVIFRISGYGQEVAPKRNEIIEVGKRKGIRIDDLEGMEWYDIGNNHNRKRNKDELHEVFSKCGMRSCVTMSNGLIGFCSRQLAAIETSLYPNPGKNEYIDLRKATSSIILEEMLSMFYEQQYISTCNYCDGIDMSNSEKMFRRQVPVAEQIR